MPEKIIDQNNVGMDKDWAGNGAAFRCPHCGKVFIVSGSRVHGGVRKSRTVESRRAVVISKRSGMVAPQAWSGEHVLVPNMLLPLNRRTTKH